jgi:hypothetical protein
MKLAAIAIVLALFFSFNLPAQKSDAHRSGPRTSRAQSSASSKSKASHVKKSTLPKKSTVAQRNANGRIKRSATARADFMRRTGYPRGRKGYVVDQIVPLECGGADDPSKMQWQTVQEAKIKDRTERNCRLE